MQDIATVTCRLAVAKARLEQKITAAKAEHAERTQIDEQKLADQESLLKSFIMTHQALFQKPRKATTAFGSFGLQAVSEVVIEDEDRFLKHVIEHAFYDCFKTVRTPVKDGIKTRLEAKETIPGCTLKTGDTAVYKVSPAFIEAEKKEALG
jgi:hypothetical protein